MSNYYTILFLYLSVTPIDSASILEPLLSDSHLQTYSLSFLLIKDLHIILKLSEIKKGVKETPF